MQKANKKQAASKQKAGKKHAKSIRKASKKQAESKQKASNKQAKYMQKTSKKQTKSKQKHLLRLLRLVVWFAWGNLSRNLAFFAFLASEHTSAEEPLGARKKLT